VEKKILRLFYTDVVAVLFFLVLAWLVMVYVLLDLIELSPDRAIQIVSTVLCLITGGFSSLALYVVIAHLKKHRDDIYREDIQNSLSLR